MGGACASKPPFRIPKVEGGTSSAVGSVTWTTSIGICWCSFWRSGGWLIWDQRVWSTVIAIALTVRTGATRDSCVWVGSLCVFCSLRWRKSPLESEPLIWPVACLCITPQTDGGSPFAAHDLLPDTCFIP